MHIFSQIRSWMFCLLAMVPIAAPAQAPSSSYALKPEQFAVIVNDDDANSIAIGEYYRQAHNVPAANLVHVRLAGMPRKIDVATFQALKQSIDSQLSAEIQAMVLLWTIPYAVECNSITAALTFGYDAKQCAQLQGAGRPNPYFDSESIKPYDDFGIRPTMLLPIESRDQARSLIDRGVAAGFQVLEGTAYYLHTSDKARNPRTEFFPLAGNVPQKKLHIKTMRRDYLEAAQDIVIYQTGSHHVPKLETLHFLPGALADHLTSFGGDLLGQTQMSCLRWLSAGATASYGTVSEPYSFWQKFPQPTVLLKHYLGGATALEAYLKSVAWPAQGLLIGDPLAVPYRRR